MSLSRAFRTAPLRQLASPAFARTQVRFATQDYGSGSGDPRAENPLEQGTNPSRDIEHPGPPAPDASKHGSKSGQEQSSSTSSKNGAQPKIQDRDQPKAEEKSEEVAKHNREMDNRAEKQAEQ